MTGRPRLPLASLLLAVAGAGVAAYLTYVHYDASALVCSVGNCEKVQTSRYAEVAGVPIALFGLSMYLALAALSLARLARPAWRSPATMAAFALSFAGALYAAYLTYLEVAVIHAICQWCVVSALLTLAILIVESVGVYRLLGEDTLEDLPGPARASQRTRT